jgi:hypothetical protein
MQKFVPPGYNFSSENLAGGLSLSSSQGLTPQLKQSLKRKNPQKHDSRSLVLNEQSQASLVQNSTMPVVPTRIFESAQ